MLICEFVSAFTFIIFCWKPNDFGFYLKLDTRLKWNIKSNPNTICVTNRERRQQKKNTISVIRFGLVIHFFSLSLVMYDSFINTIVFSCHTYVFLWMNVVVVSCVFVYFLFVGWFGQSVKKSVRTISLSLLLITHAMSTFRFSLSLLWKRNR